MSGQDGLRGAVAAILAKHRIHDRRPGEVTCWACLPDGWMDGGTYFGHLADAVLLVVQRHTDAAREQVAEQARSEQDAVHADLRKILLALGLGDHARPYSSHEVVQREVLLAIAAAVARAEQAEQAVQRVRELHDDVEQMTNIVGTNDYAKGQRSAMRWVAARLRRALAESKVSL